MAVCGPKLSICCMILGIWGVIQLGLMGVFFYIHAVALADDIAADFEEAITSEGIHAKIDDAYQQSAINCWIAAAMYCGVTALAAQQFWANQRK